MGRPETLSEAIYDIRRTARGARERVAALEARSNLSDIKAAGLKAAVDRLEEKMKNAERSYFFKSMISAGKSAQWTPLEEGMRVVPHIDKHSCVKSSDWAVIKVLMVLVAVGLWVAPLAILLGIFLKSH